MRSPSRSFFLATTIVACAITSVSAQMPGRQPPPNGALPRVSPDGKHVLFLRATEGQPMAYVMDSDGSNPRPLASSNQGGGSWLPDGKRILAMQRRSRTEPGRLMISSVDGGEPHEIPRGDLDPGYAEVLGDGKTVLVANAKRDSTGRMQSFTWYTMDLDGSHVRPLRMPEITGRWLGLRPSRDGKRIAFIVADTTDPTTPFRSTTLYVMNLDGSGQRTVATVPDGMEQLSWSYDGKKDRAPTRRPDSASTRAAAAGLRTERQHRRHRRDDGRRATNRPSRPSLSRRDTRLVAGWAYLHPKRPRWTHGDLPHECGRIGSTTNHEMSWR